MPGNFSSMLVRKNSNPCYSRRWPQTCFHRHVQKHDYRMFDGPSRIRHKQAWGGVILLIKSSLRCRWLASYSDDDGQVVPVVIENFAVSTLHQPPQESRLSNANHLIENLQLLPNGTPWFCVGDFNDCPDENMLVSHGDSLGLDGLVIVVLTMPLRMLLTLFVMFSMTVKQLIADHKTFCCRIALGTHFEPVITHRFVERDDLSKHDSCSLAEWHQACCDYLTTQTLPQPPLHCNQQTIDCYWRRLNFLFDDMLRHATC